MLKVRYTYLLNFKQAGVLCTFIVTGRWRKTGQALKNKSSSKVWPLTYETQYNENFKQVHSTFIPLLTMEDSVWTTRLYWRVLLLCL